MNNLPNDAPWWARWIVDNWNQIWYHFSTWFITLGAIVVMIPPDLWMQVGVSEPWQRRMTALCAAAAIVSKYVKQRNLT